MKSDAGKKTGWCMSMSTMVAVGAVVTAVFLLAALILLFLKQGASFSMALSFPDRRTTSSSYTGRGGEEE